MRYILGVRIKYLTFFIKILFTYWITCAIAPANRMNKFEGFFKYFHGKNIKKKIPWNSWCSGFNLPTFETSVSAILSNSTPTIRPSDIDRDGGQVSLSLSRLKFKHFWPAFWNVIPIILFKNQIPELSAYARDWSAGAGCGSGLCTWVHWERGISYLSQKFKFVAPM